VTGSAVSPSTPATSAGRPVAATVVALLAVAVGVYLMVDGVRTLTDAAGGDTGAIADGIIHVGLGLFALAIATGALRVRPWAWKLFMTLAVVGLTIDILRHFSFGAAHYGRMALNAFVVFALTPRDVQVAFGIRAPPNADLTRATRNPLDRD
jgi:hypothetical protein